MAIAGLLAVASLPAAEAGIKANFWTYLGAALQYVPEADEDHGMRVKLTAIGIGPGKKFDIIETIVTLAHTLNMDIIAKGEMPPVNVFWSVMMYYGKSQLMVENPINRYLVNTAMTSGVKKNADGSLTIYIQKDSPGKDKEISWLPAPNDTAYLLMRLYWPKPATETVSVLQGLLEAARCRQRQLRCQQAACRHRQRSTPERRPMPSFLKRSPTKLSKRSVVLISMR